MFPAIVLVHPQIDLDKGPPFGSLRLSYEPQSCLQWGTIALPRVTGNAGADDILPRCRPALVPGYDMIKV